MATLNYIDRQGLTTLWGLVSAELRKKLTAEDIADIESAVGANTAAIKVLNGTGDGSVAKMIADGIAAVVAGAPEAFDTLKEMSDWISGHGSDVTEMNSNISANTSGLDALKSLVGTLPEEATAQTLVEYIQDLTEGMASDAGIAEMKTAIEDLQGKAHTHANKEALDTVTTAKIAEWDATVTSKHNHTNISTLNGINDARVAAWDAAQKNAETYAKGLVDGLDTMTALTEEEIKAICVIN